MSNFLSPKPDIQKLKAKCDIDGLTKALSYANDAEIRIEAAWGLSEIGNAQAVCLLADALKNSYYYDVRKEAALALGKMSDEHTKEVLVDALKDPIDEVRFAAAFSLSQLGDSRAAETLITAKNSNNKELSERASKALMKIRGSQMGSIDEVSQKSGYPSELHQPLQPLMSEMNDKKKLAYSWKNKADNLDGAGRHEAAIECYNKALELNPQFVDAWYNKGLAFENKGLFDKALLCYNKVLELSPKDAGAWYNKADCEDKLKRISDAASSYRRFLSLSYSGSEMSNEVKIAKRRLQQLE